MSAINRSQYPADGIPEIALVGRSNVGKSSTVNTLLNRRNFARTSQTPGKTRTINFYLINKEFFFVDLPGYGYAKIAKSEKDKWGVIMERYLQDRPELCAIFLLVDIRHEPTNDDVMMYEWIKHFGYNCVVIATKADKISRGQYQKHFNIIRKKLQLEKDEKIEYSIKADKSGVYVNINDKNWNCELLGELCTIVRGGSPRPIEQFLGGNVPWIKIGDATYGDSIYLNSTKEHIIEEGVKKSRFVKAGSLIFANCGVSLGFARIITFDGCIHDGWLAMEDIDERLDKVFLLQALNQMTEHFRAIAPVGTQPNLNTAIMKKYKQVIPPIELQRKFIRFLEQIDKSKVNYYYKNRKDGFPPLLFIYSVTTIINLSDY